MTIITKAPAITAYIACAGGWTCKLHQRRKHSVQHLVVSSWLFLFLILIA